MRTVQFWIEAALLPEVETRDELLAFAEGRGVGDHEQWAMARLFEVYETKRGASSN